MDCVQARGVDRARPNRSHARRATRGSDGGIIGRVRKARVSAVNQREGRIESQIVDWQNGKIRIQAVNFSLRRVEDDICAGDKLSYLKVRVLVVVSGKICSELVVKILALEP